jgi:Raf kinase inhibitor-like YbhB/YbcL family protein
LRVFLVIVLLVLFSGCISDQQGERTTARDESPTDEETPTEQWIQKEEEATMKQISVSSNAFEHGSSIPVDYTCDGADRSPALSWEGLPDGTQSIALIVDDPDAPGRTFVHWVIYNIPANITGLPAAMPKNSSLKDGSMQGKNDFGRIGYFGPCPPPGKPHRYFFKVYALDTVLNLKSGASDSQLEAAMSGHILAQGEMVGKFGR